MFLYSARCGSVPDRTNYDLVVIGGGIVGVATAREVARRHPNLQIALLEKEICLGKAFYSGTVCKVGLV